MDLSFPKAPSSVDLFMAPLLWPAPQLLRVMKLSFSLLPLSCHSGFPTHLLKYPHLLWLLANLNYRFLVP